MISASSCKDCLDCVGANTVNVKYITQQIDVDPITGDNIITYPAFWDTTFTGRQIMIDFCDGEEKWKDYDGKEKIVVESIGDSTGSGAVITTTRFGHFIYGAQITTTTTDWQCN